MYCVEDGGPYYAATLHTEVDVSVLPPFKASRFMVFVQTGKHSWSRWDVGHAFIHGWVSHACCKLHVSLHVTCCGPQRDTHHGTCPLECVSHHRPQQGVPTCVSTRGEQSWQDARNYVT